MTRTLNAKLSSTSIRSLIKSLNTYKDSIEKKNQQFIKELCKVGLDEAIVRFSEVTEEGYVENARNAKVSVVYDSLGRLSSATIHSTGDGIIFIEFSAGITYGIGWYPLPSGNNYGMGTYPGKGHWDDPNGWWYKDPTGATHIEVKYKKNGGRYEKETPYLHTYGVAAHMPMFHADEAMLLQYVAIARKIFG